MFLSTIVGYKLLFGEKLDCMGRQTPGNTIEERKDDSKVDKWIAETDNIKHNLSSLKDDIRKDKETSKTILHLTDTNFESDFEKEFSNFDKKIDKIAEQDFDAFAQKNRPELQLIIDDNNPTTRKQKLDAFALKFQTSLFAQTDEYVVDIKALAEKSFKIEINDLRDKVKEPSQDD